MVRNGVVDVDVGVEFRPRESYGRQRAARLVRVGQGHETFGAGDESRGSFAIFSGHLRTLQCGRWFGGFLCDAKLCSRPAGSHLVTGALADGGQRLGIDNLLEGRDGDVGVFGLERHIQQFLGLGQPASARSRSARPPPGG
jgi:hypothetical protein